MEGHPGEGVWKDVTNWEVLNFLQLRTKASAFVFSRTTDVTPDAGAVQALAVASTGFGAVKMTGAGGAAAISSLQASARTRELKWLVNKTMGYLQRSPAGCQSRDILQSTLAVLDDGGTDVGRGMGITPREKVQIINMRAVTPLQLNLVFASRTHFEFLQEQLERLAARLAEVMPPDAPPVVKVDSVPLSGPPAVPAGAELPALSLPEAAPMKRARSASIASAASVGSKKAGGSKRAREAEPAAAPAVGGKGGGAAKKAR